MGMRCRRARPACPGWAAASSVRGWGQGEGAGGRLSGWMGRGGCESRVARAQVTPPAASGGQAGRQAGRQRDARTPAHLPLISLALPSPPPPSPPPPPTHTPPPPFPSHPPTHPSLSPLLRFPSCAASTSSTCSNVRSPAARYSCSSATRARSLCSTWGGGGVGGWVGGVMSVRSSATRARSLCSTWGGGEGGWVGGGVGWGVRVGEGGRGLGVCGVRRWGLQAKGRRRNGADSPRRLQPAPQTGLEGGSEPPGAAARAARARRGQSDGGRRPGGSGRGGARGGGEGGG